MTTARSNRDADPFADPPSIYEHEHEHQHQHEHSNTPASDTLLIDDREVSALVLRAECVTIRHVGLGPRKDDRTWNKPYWCGLGNVWNITTPSGITTTHIPYSNILDAYLSSTPPTVTIEYARCVSKASVHPTRLAYAIPSDKSAIEQASAFLNTLLARSYAHSQQQKRILVLINPFGGQGRAEQLWTREAKPIFTAAKCSLDTQVTAYRGHAVEIAEQLDIDKYDVVACCSGDGLPHEVFNGLAKQRSPRIALSKIAVVQIPCGTGNAMSLNLNGTESPSLAALAIVKGVRRPLDLVSITQGENRYLSFLSQAVGIVAESDLGTENLRWMGSARFTYGFLVRLLGKTVYPCDVAMKVEIESKEAIKESWRKARTQDVSVEDGQNRVREAEAHDEDETQLPPLRYGTVKQPLPEGWHMQAMPELGNFYCGNMLHMSSDSPIFPCALPCDGRADLVTVAGTIPRLAAIDLLLSVGKGTFMDKPLVDYRKVSAYRIIPRGDEGYISVDGERVPFAPFQAEVHRGLGCVLSRGGSGYCA
ncbi:sphinganine kinase lcb4 [Elasticomyces elasticus]|nr:sphinganine kinase lcb4 [Elasticomyces elasticus]